MVRRRQSTRRSAEERRQLVIAAAREEFAAYGLYGATGDAISYRAGISHPYLLRLFGSKRDLFLAVVDSFFDELLARLRPLADGGDSGGADAPEAVLQQALGEGSGLTLLLQCCAACAEDEIRPVVRRRMLELHRELMRATGAGDDEVGQMFARLMLASATAAMRLPEVAGREHSARGLLEASSAD
jgi:AcrR family transcriptional regulator